MKEYKREIQVVPICELNIVVVVAVMATIVIVGAQGCEIFTFSTRMGQVMLRERGELCSRQVVQLRDVFTKDI